MSSVIEANCQTGQVATRSLSADEEAALDAVCQVLQAQEDAREQAQAQREQARAAVKANPAFADLVTALGL